MEFLLDAADILQALLQAKGPEDATFQRMVVTYRRVAESLGCGPAYEQLVMGLLAGLTPVPQAVA